MGNLAPFCKDNSVHLEFLESSLYRHAEVLESVHGIIRKKHLIQFLIERGNFREYHDSKVFVLNCITKAKAHNIVYETKIYQYNTETEWTYSISSPDEACALACAKQLHCLNGFFSRDSLMEQLKMSMNPPMHTDSMSHLVGRVLSTGLKVGSFNHEIAYRLKCPVLHMPEACPSEGFDELSFPASSSSAATDIVHMNTCY